MFLVHASDERWNLPYARNTRLCEGMCLAVRPWDIPILPGAWQHTSLHMKCGLGRTCSTEALVQAQQWDTADWGELHSIAGPGMTLLFAAEDTQNAKAKDAGLKLSFSQVSLISEAILPLVVICINKYEVSACFSSLHFLAKGNLQGFVTSEHFFLPWCNRVSNVLLNELFAVKLYLSKLSLCSSKTFSGCTTHPAIATPGDKMTEVEHLSKKSDHKKNHRVCLKYYTSLGKSSPLVQSVLKKVLSRSVLTICTGRLWTPSVPAGSLCPTRSFCTS